MAQTDGLNLGDWVNLGAFVLSASVAFGAGMRFVFTQTRRYTSEREQINAQIYGLRQEMGTLLEGLRRDYQSSDESRGRLQDSAIRGIQESFMAALNDQRKEAKADLANLEARLTGAIDRMEDRLCQRLFPTRGGASTRRSSDKGTAE